ncbi:replicative DNA helicase [Oceanobacillus arenosus]|uniref:DNA 5'-3' helicase n=1 Tax=Oceanobacillus arenosus TaxID=1229153 RepID=A0A3D8PQF3_9BACI|nr:replicative DNA helicase [Oceanobacillus arenosus]RDW17501.1 replicative DNA helicase [Oceanobacillus arenosus]
MDTYYAETSILGSILIEGTLFKELEINEMYFTHNKHRQILLAMKQGYKEREVVDIVIVTTVLGDKIEEVGGVTYLTELAESVPSTTTFKHYQQILIDAYQLREAQHAIQQFLSNPSNTGLERLLQDLQACRDSTLAKEEKSTYDNLVEIGEELMKPRPENLGYLTSLASFDQITGGLKGGDLIILAARPSVGKTAFALNLASGHCKNGGSSLIYSLEMGTKQLLKRMISAEGMVNASKWHDISKRFTTNDYKNAMRAIGEMTTWELEIFATKHTISEIRAGIRKQVHENPKQNHLVFIDYLQLIKPSISHRDRRDLEIGEMTRELKLLALELNIPIVLLSQLSRSVDSRQDKRPLMSDLRESGNIEQDADVISFLYRDDYYDKRSKQKNEMEVIIAKQRNGPTGTVRVEFLREFGVVREEVGVLC